MPRHACICSAHYSTVGGNMHWLGLQTTNTEEETSHPTCLPLLKFRVSLHQKRTHLCTMESSLFTSYFLVTHVVFNFRDANNDHVVSFPTSACCTAMFWLKQLVRWQLVEYKSHGFPCLGTVASHTVHTWPRTVASTPYLCHAQVHK